MRPARLLSVAVLLSAAACGGSSAGITGNITGASSMSATIDGKAWSSSTLAATYQNGVFTITGTSSDLLTTVTLTVAAQGPGTYSLAFAPNVNSVATVTKVTGVGSAQTWLTGALGGTGTVTISTLSTGHYVGSFSFDAPLTSTGTASVTHVTNGSFRVGS
jgi:hypothetical protein